MKSWPSEAEYCDVLVVGSGASGLTAAITAAHGGLDVVVAEKANVFGGTSAWSGGWLWIPRNSLAREAQIIEDNGEARQYLDTLLGNRADHDRLNVFLENGPKMVDFLSRIGAMRWLDGNGVPDFYEHEGARAGGRSVTAEPMDGRDLGTLIDKLRKPLQPLTVAGMAINSGSDMAHFFKATRSFRSMIYVAGRLARHGFDLATKGRSMQLVGGNALVARLLKKANSLGVRLWSDSPLCELICEENRVIGAKLCRGGTTLHVRTRQGVILAGGGFPHDGKRQGDLFPAHGPTGHQSAAPRANTGETLRIAEAVGARTDTTVAEMAAWAPVSQLPSAGDEAINFPHLVDRAKPGFIAVNRRGHRFVNEADSYYDFMVALFEDTPSGEDPSCWLICDHRAQRQFGIGAAKPFPFPLKAHLKSGYLKRGRSLRALANQIELPAGALEQTVETFNRFAKDGLDPEFKRGSSAYNRVQGWPDNPYPNPSLRPLDKGPFYAVKLVPGSLGTFAGLSVDAVGRVLDEEQQPIDGLYAVGNDAVSVMAGHYPSGGITLGPGMTFGYVTGRLLSGEPVLSISNHESISKERMHSNDLL
ncbi:FAD-dependent oxidoreductase [Notoacmeibacter sp. MSK16QG-6]|uniref:FAD-dependent oxidoreductase n=1 Tax=Notoacmeibacter sp. MSK16QG-6 TaxID=2957982 RepID=UPI0020A188F4|nr:FAD-dependent oxidoreductase [Notoacmeibacter sp. MSK16QG-6]